MSPNGHQLRAHNKRVAAMLADPECVGELLLVGIAIARSVDLNDPPLGEGVSLATFADRIYGPTKRVYTSIFNGEETTHTRYPGRDQLNEVIREDIRRYQPNEGPGFHFVHCGRPMIRRDGTCDRNASANYTKRFTDPVTGHQSWVGACTQKPCVAWFQDLRARNAAELKTNPAPTPAANVGGVLDRHLPEIDWYTIWRHLDERWTPPPEAQPWTRPKFTLIVDSEPEEAPVTTKPSLTVIEGGWR